jgi:hypothetical protein
METVELRLKRATEAELGRLRKHLGLADDAAASQIAKAYQEAAENSLATYSRPMLKSTEPNYLQILRLIYKELRSYGEAFDESWHAVKTFKFWSHKSSYEELEEDELESRIFEMYAAKYAVAKGSGSGVSTFWRKAAKYIPGLAGASTGAAVTATAATATKFPFAGVAPGLVTGPVGIATAVVLIGVQALGPAFRKIVPATVELILIGRRIEFTPEDE